MSVHDDPLVDPVTDPELWIDDGTATTSDGTADEVVDRSSLEERAQRLTDGLSAAVQAATNGTARSARPGQAVLATDIEATMHNKGKHLAAEAPTGLGKALALDTPVPTTSGWSTMGDLQVGDELFDENGQVCRVTEAFQVRIGRPCYEMAFSDGAVIVADAEHQWATTTRSLRAVQSERRRAERRSGSRLRMEKLERIEALADSLSPETAMVTAREADCLLEGLIDPSSRASHARLSGMPPLRRGEKFDLRYFLDTYLKRAGQTCALRSPTPPAFEVVTTAAISETVRSSDGALNHAVAVAGALNLPGNDQLVDPYILGVWLGDGTSSAGSVTVGYGDLPEMTAAISAAWVGTVVTHERPGAATLVLRAPRLDLCPYGHDAWYQAETRANRLCRVCQQETMAGRRGRTDRRWNENLAEQLRSIGVLNAKHVPVNYLRGSFAQRLALLQGLMDTDGSVTKNGDAEITLCNETLARDVTELVRSLGIRATCHSSDATITERTASGSSTRRVVGTRWRIHFTTTIPVFRMGRKLDRQQTTVSSRNPLKLRNRYLRSCEPVASVPVRCIAVDSPNHLFLAGTAMVPTHNSLAYLIPAGLAASKGERTVVSTESLNLQAQIIDKDGPVAADAVAEVTGYRPHVAVLKGWSNYGCALQAVATAQEILGDQFAGSVAPSLAKTLDRLNDLGSGPQSTFFPKTQTADVELVQWVLDQYVNGGDGDKHAYPGKIGDREWETVAVSSAECVGVEACPYGDVCRANAARKRAAAADIVVTNHSMLAIQAAKAVPVVIGSRKLGTFRHVIVDEAHALASEVRSKGAVDVAGRRIVSVVWAMRRLLDDKDQNVASLISDGDQVAKYVDEAIAKEAKEARAKDKSKGRGKVARLGTDDDPLAWCAGSVETWLSRVNHAAEKARSQDAKTVMSRRRLESRIDSLKDDIRMVREHRVGVARWIEDDDNGAPILKASPVEVGSMLWGQVWTAEVPVDKQGELLIPESEWTGPADGMEAPRYGLSVAAVSATLPNSFAHQMGLSARVQKYESPFDAAYGDSLLYVPSAHDDMDVRALAAPGGRDGKRRMDTGFHAPWAASHAVELVEANGGSALVLSATTAAGKTYVERLRDAAAGRWKVLSQWDGESTRRLLDAWRDDETSVLVGTKKLMTGVDAPGTTCTLVIMDRVPRAPFNPVDDARVEVTQKALDLSRWSADTFIYATDAALLLEQAAGRLIRSTSDSGMVAVLDPRLLKKGPFSMAKNARETYLEALARFEHRTAKRDRAIKFLTDRRDGHTGSP